MTITEATKRRDERLDQAYEKLMDGIAAIPTGLTLQEYTEAAKPIKEAHDQEVDEAVRLYKAEYRGEVVMVSIPENDE